MVFLIELLEIVMGGAASGLDVRGIHLRTCSMSGERACVILMSLSACVRVRVCVCERMHVRTCVSVRACVIVDFSRSWSREVKNGRMS